MPSFEDYQLIAFTNALQGTLETATPGNGVLASAAQAIAGANTTAIMTPFTTAQALASVQFDFAPLDQAVPLSNDGVGYVLGKTGTGDYDFDWITAGTGTVQTISIDTANGFAGGSDGDPTNPSIALQTTVSGILSGFGGALVSTPTTGAGNIVLSTGATLVGPNLGTPSAINLANATNFPREQQRVTATASTATLTPNADTSDIAAVTAQAASLAVAAPTGTPVDGQRLTIRIRDNGTTRALTWNAAYVQFATGQLPSTTVINKTHYFVFWWNASTSVWELVGGNPVAGLWA